MFQKRQKKFLYTKKIAGMTTNAPVWTGAFMLWGVELFYLTFMRNVCPALERTR